jgi:hypothetical protein
MASEGSCLDFKLYTDTAHHLFVEWQTYREAAQGEEAKLEFKAFSHELDVAKAYINGCSDKASLRAYWQMILERASLMASDEDDIYAKKITATTVRAALQSLYELGFAKTDPDAYQRDKVAVVSAYQRAGLELRSVETDRVIVKQNRAISDCSKDDHPASLVKLGAARVDVPAGYSDTFHVSVSIDTDDSIRSGPHVFPDHLALDGNRRDAQREWESALDAAFTLATYQHEIRGCIPVNSFLDWEVTVSGRTMSLRRTI